MAVENGITSCTTSYIYPSNKHQREPPPSKIPLSALDEVHDHRQVHFYWLFPSISGPVNPVIDKLKESLAEALEYYLPMAGTLYCHDDDTGWYIATDSNNIQGTPFHFETRNTPYDINEDCTIDFTPRGFEPAPPGASIFAVKITQFSCGALLICESTSHNVLDLHALFNFMKIWSQLARGEFVDSKSLPDDWSRQLSRFFPPHKGEPVNPFLRTANPSAAVAGVSPHKSSPQQQGNIVVWKITKRSVDRLKMDISASATSKDQWVSFGDALTALFFGAVTRAREKANVPRTAGLRSSIESQTESLYAVFDSRSRALPEGKQFQYFGNGTVLCKTNVPRVELLSPTIEATSRVALTIRNDFRNQLTPDAIANYIAFYEDLKLKKRSPGEIFPPMDVFCLNYTKFEKQLDFGWGQSYKTSLSKMQLSAGQIGMAMDDGTGDIAVMSSVEIDCTKHFLSDPLLNKYGTSENQWSKL